MAVAQKGFLLFLEHQAVVYGALAKLGIRPHHSDFQDWRDEGMLVYLNYFDRYRDPLTDAAAITKFNKLAWRFVFLTLMQRMQKVRHRRALEEAPANAAVLQTATVATTPTSLEQSVEVKVKLQLRQLEAILTPVERRVLQLRLAGLADTGIARQLQISRQRVLKVRKRIQVKYRQLELEGFLNG
ncbi:DNA-binding response regulator [Lacticaseibacillus paracasei]|uniref:DNA-binding response regulator n=1 Tax=Lacticaseibacillus paracasei TaxID=1597 RepID=UPI0022321B29|nr:DNA-binding response regulator [Lacticaseibacillus paracasei]UZD26734.1 DNA-binding response regulator [Lacticaseibacillus paracasei]